MTQLSYSKPVLSVSLIKEYYYCPVIAWIMYHRAPHINETPSMIEGQKIDYEKIADKNNLPKPRVYGPCIENKEIGLRGCIDIVAGDKKKVVIEVKKYDRPENMLEHFKIQSLVYAYLYNKTYGGVVKYGLIMSDRSYVWDYTWYDEEKAQKLIDLSVKNIVRNEPPRPSTPRKCSYCLLRKKCPYQGNLREKDKIIIV